MCECVCAGACVCMSVPACVRACLCGVCVCLHAWQCVRACVRACQYGCAGVTLVHSAAFCETMVVYIADTCWLRHCRFGQ